MHCTGPSFSSIDSDSTASAILHHHSDVMFVSIVSVRKTKGRELFQLFISRFQHLAWTQLKTSERCKQLILTSVRAEHGSFLEMCHEDKAGVPVFALV